MANKEPTIREQIADALSSSGGSSGSSGGGSTTSSSTGGTGAPRASSGPSKAELQARANAAASFQAILAGWQIPVTPELQGLIQKAVQAGMNSAAFINTLRKTKAYAQRFSGIMRANGSMRMTESQYLSGYMQARDTARALGRNFSQQAYGAAIKNGNSPSEIKMKLEAVDKLKSYGPMYRQFSEYLQATGVTKKPLERGELLTFIMGKGPKAWTDAYQTSLVAAQLESSGLDVGKPAEGGDIGYRGLSKLAKEIEALGQGGSYTDLLAKAEKVLGQGDWKDMGVSTKDKVALTLGARSAGKSAQRVVDAVNARVAALTEPRANPQFAQGPKGSQMLTGNRPVQSTE